MQKCVAKYMLYFDLHVFGVKHFKNATKTFIHLPRAHLHAKKIAKMCPKYMLYIDLYVFEAKNFKMQPKIQQNKPVLLKAYNSS